MNVRCDRQKIGDLRVKNWSRAPENCTNILHKENKKMYLGEQKTMEGNPERERTTRVETRTNFEK
jgi:hypothetical protein